MQRNEGGETPAEVLRARIRRRCEAEVPPRELPPRCPTDDRGRCLSIADVLRNRRTLRFREAESRAAELASLDSGSRGFGVECVSRMTP